MKKIRIKYTATAPISHIGETASTGSYFQTIKTADGRLPIITGNSVRGILRDFGAKHLLERLGTKVDKETFHVLFSGGNLNGTMKNDVEKAKNVREHFPFISLLGGGLGDMIMSGKVCIGNLYPICKETCVSLGEDFTEVSWKNLIDEIEFTRTDDGKDDTLSGYISDPEEEKKAKASTQMRYSVQYMAKGTEFVQDVYFNENVTDLELGAFFSALCDWFRKPMLGGMAAKGFGNFDAEVKIDDDFISTTNGEVEISKKIVKLIEEYDQFIDGEGSEFLPLLRSGKK